MRRSAVVGALCCIVAVAACRFAALGAVALPSSSSAAVEVHYAPSEDLEAIDVALIGDAGVSIDVDAYLLTDIPVIEALRAAAADRGVRERIYRNPAEWAPRPAIAAAIAALAATDGVAIRFKRPGPLMHLKSYCVDGATLRTGAANLTWSGEHEQDNDLVVIRAAGACARFEAKFERDWSAAPP